MGTTNQTKESRKLIVGVGSALVDILSHEDDAFLERTGAVKGGMIYVDPEQIEAILLRTSKRPALVPGGSACNTVIGVGKLGGRARFVGKSGTDEMGDLIEADLRRNNVEPSLLKSSSPTGRVLSIITPDAERSMLTYLGAASEVLPEEMAIKNFEDAAIVHVEGYLFFNADLIFATLRSAKTAGALVSLDLSSFTVVEASKSYLEKMVDEFVDILIANEDEALAYTGFADEEKALERLSEKVDIGVLKVGPRGSYISRAGNIKKIEPRGTGAAVDTTGAGDLWASGFLFGLVNGFPLEKCGELGSACGYEVCQVVGTKIPEDAWQRIRQLVEE
ncbi:adenosine kinase [Thermodesulfobacteriota bacterium]